MNCLKTSNGKNRRVLNKLRQLSEQLQQDDTSDLSDWEIDFIESLNARIEEYGSAFADWEKGKQGEALSFLQQAKLKEITKKLKQAKVPNNKVRQVHLNDAHNEEECEMSSLTKRSAPKKSKLAVINNPNPPDQDVQAYIPRCAKPIGRRKLRLVSTNTG